MAFFHCFRDFFGCFCCRCELFARFKIQFSLFLSPSFYLCTMHISLACIKPDSTVDIGILLECSCSSLSNILLLSFAFAFALHQHTAMEIHPTMIFRWIFWHRWCATTAITTTTTKTAKPLRPFIHSAHEYVRNIEWEKRHSASEGEWKVDDCVQWFTINWAIYKGDFELSNLLTFAALPFIILQQRKYLEIV